MVLHLMFCQGALEWRPRLDNPNVTGWSVVAFYELAALACARAALLARSRVSADGPREKETGWAGIWWGLALALCFLGINKQLNLQTLLFVIGRKWSLAGGWYGQRRMAQWAFNLAFGLGLGLLLIWLMMRHRGFFQRHRRILWGLLILAFFVVWRSSTFNHANPLGELSLREKGWTWVLEIGGSIFIGIGAVQASHSTENRR